MKDEGNRIRKQVNFNHKKIYFYKFVFVIRKKEKNQMLMMKKRKKNNQILKD